MTQEHPDDFDSPWKEALEQALPELLALFFPEARAGIECRGSAGIECRGSDQAKSLHCLGFAHL